VVLLLHSAGHAESPRLFAAALRWLDLGLGFAITPQGHED